MHPCTPKRTLCLSCLAAGLSVLGVSCILLDRGPDAGTGGLESQGKDLHEVIAGGDLRELDQALQSGADPNQADPDGFTPLQAAVVLADISPTALGQVQALLAHGARPNQVNSFGQTALHYAACREVREGGAIMTLLVEAGGDPHIGTYEITPFEIALSEGSRAAVFAIEQTTDYKPPGYARLKTEGEAVRVLMEGFEKAAGDQDRKDAIEASLDELVHGGLLAEQEAEILLYAFIQVGLHRASGEREQILPEQCVPEDVHLIGLMAD